MNVRVNKENLDSIRQRFSANAECLTIFFLNAALIVGLIVIVYIIELFLSIRGLASTIGSLTSKIIISVERISAITLVIFFLVMDFIKLIKRINKSIKK